MYPCLFFVVLLYRVLYDVGSKFTEPFRIWLTKHDCMFTSFFLRFINMKVTSQLEYELLNKYDIETFL